MKRSPIPIVALDVRSADDALALARSVSDSCRFFKVGSELFTAAGPDVVRMLREELDAEIFLDLKFHDIPNTVASAVAGAVRLGAKLLTVHVSGGAEMLRAARASAGDACGVLGVTVLTSFDAASLASTWGREPLLVEDEVMRLANLAREAQLHGIVCAGTEAARVRERHGDLLSMLIPGIRLSGSAMDDQRRIITPAGARDAGARYLILGRTVTAAANPAAAMEMVLAQLNS